MRRSRRPALLFFLLPTLVALSGCGGGDNTNTTNTNASANANANLSTRARLDDALRNMAEGSAVFTPPPASMKLGESVVLSFVISPNQTPKEIEEQVREQVGADKVESNRIQISDRMLAQLKGDGDRFHIESRTEEETQYVRREGQTKWAWKVRADQAGEHYLYLYLYALVDLGDGAGERRISVTPYNPKHYLVTVPAPPGRVWPWLLPALLVPAGGVAAWLWLRGRKKSRRTAAHFFSPGVGEARIFLSYRREDTAGHAGRLRDALVERFGPERVFMDLDSIRGGDDFVEALERAVASCAVVIVVIGRQWVSAPDKGGRRRLDDPKDFVRLEVEAALRRGIKVIPALVQEAEMPGEESLPAPLAKLARRNAMEISDSRWDYDAGRLLAVIEDALAHKPAKPPEAGAPTA
jgi:hypothetical protein